jgi:hypothetical protein
MKNITRHTGTLQIIQRLNNSLSGNPRYQCFIDGVNFYTAPNSMHAYGITNYRDKVITVTIGTYYGKPTLNNIEG